MPSIRLTAVFSRGLATVAFVGALVLAPAAASAADPTVSLNGCTGTLDAQPKGGGTGTQVTAPTAQSASKSDPIVVNWDDKFVYNGSSTAVITDQHWTAWVAGIPVATGGSANASQKTTATGSVEIKKVLPLKLTGLYFVKFELKGSGGSCTGETWLKLAGNPLTTIPFWIGVVVALGGLYGLYWSLPRIRADGSTDLHFVGGALAGLMLGLGLLIALIVSSLAAFSQWWPYAVILGGAVFLGLLTGTVGPKRGLIMTPAAAPAVPVAAATAVPVAAAAVPQREADATGLLCNGADTTETVDTAGIQCNDRPADATGLLCNGRDTTETVDTAGIQCNDRPADAAGLLCNGADTAGTVDTAGLQCNQKPVDTAGFICDGAHTDAAEPVDTAGIQCNDRTGETRVADPADELSQPPRPSDPDQA
jgi:hypothetical protein